MRRLTYEDFIARAIKTHENKYRYDKVVYKDYYTKVEIYCHKHGYFWQTPSNHLHVKGYGCQQCAKVFRYGTKEFVEKAVEIHGNKYSYERVVYKNAKTKVTITCDRHGDFKQTPDIHLSGNGCKKCYIEACRSSSDEFVKKAKIIHGDKYSYDDVVYINSTTKITIICPKHGKFKQSPSSHLQKHGCPRCLSVYKQNKWLDILGIPNDSEHREVSIRIHKKLFKVDGFVPETKTVYEFNGDSWHGNPKHFRSIDIHPQSKKPYGVLYEATIHKQNVLINAGFKVVSIWESDFDRGFI